MWKLLQYCISVVIPYLVPWKPVWTTLASKRFWKIFCCQLCLSALITLALGFCIGINGEVPKAFEEMIAIKAPTFLACIGADLVFFSMFFPCCPLLHHWLKCLGVEALKFAVSGYALVLGVMIGVSIFPFPDCKLLIMGVYSIMIFTFCIVLCVLCQKFPKVYSRFEIKQRKQFILIFLFFLACYSTYRITVSQWMWM